jgi:hypothetical protein
MADDDGKTPAVPEGYFTAEQLEQARREAIEQARREERDKLYPQQNRTKEQLDAMKAELEELRKAEQARQKERDKAAADAEKARKAKEEAELSAKELLAQREQTWQQKLDAIKAEQDARLAEITQAQQVQQAMWEKEREMAALQIYIRDRVAAESEHIAPELMDFIGGNTKEEVDASIEVVKSKTAAIVEGMRQAQIAQRAGMPGVSPSGGATAVVPGLDTGDQKLTPEDIQGMSMADFAKLRAKVGMGSNGGRGIFG